MCFPNSQPGNWVAEEDVKVARRECHLDNTLLAIGPVRHDAAVAEGRNDSALEWARRAVAQPNSGVWSNATMAIALAHLDRLEEAREALDALIEEKPDMALSFVAETLPFRRECDRLIFEDGLRRAGLAT